MLRLYKNLVVQLFYSMLQLKRYGQSTSLDHRKQINSAYRYLIHDSNPTIESIAKVVHLIRNNERGDEEYPDQDELIEILGKQIKGLYEDGAVNNDGNLVDTIVEILKLPYAKNVLSGRALKSLKDAILIPEELSTLRRVLGEKEWNCGSCGKKLMDGEMVTLHTDSFNNVSVLCVECRLPEVVGCMACKNGEKSQLDAGKLTSFLKRTAGCERHLKDEAGPTEARGIFTRAVIRSDGRLRPSPVQEELNRMENMLNEPPPSTPIPMQPYQGDTTLTITEPVPSRMADDPVYRFWLNQTAPPGGISAGSSVASGRRASGLTRNWIERYMQAGGGPTQGIQDSVPGTVTIGWEPAPDIQGSTIATASTITNTPTTAAPTVFNEDE